MPIVAALIIWMFGLDIVKEAQRLWKSTVTWVTQAAKKSEPAPVKRQYQVPKEGMLTLAKKRIVTGMRQFRRRRRGPSNTARLESGISS